jgi:hypothetical protein
VSRRHQRVLGARPRALEPPRRPAPHPADLERRTEEGPLHGCPRCTSELVHPEAWAERGPDHWLIHRRCPECGWRGEGVFAQRLADAFDDELDRGTDALVHDLRRLTRANMAEHVERFADALARGAVQPMDF